MSAVETATRCPFCHESILAAEEPWVVCAACLARHHEECWNEHARCATCACDAALAPLRRPLPFDAPVTGARLSRPLLASFAALAVAALALAVAIVTPAAGHALPRWTLPAAVALLFLAAGGALGALLVWPPRRGEATVPAAEPFVAADGTLERLRNRLDDVRERRASSRRGRVAD